MRAGTRTELDVDGKKTRLDVVRLEMGLGLGSGAGDADDASINIALWSLWL